MASPESGLCQTSWPLPSPQPGWRCKKKRKKDRKKMNIHDMSARVFFFFPKWPAFFHLDEFFFWHCDSEVEMTEAAGDHGAQLKVETLLVVRGRGVRHGEDTFASVSSE